jgi:DNA-formamidopyrimidine glycosylase
MPEGHTVHRTANEFNRLFAGGPVHVESPQGRFTESAKLISDRTLVLAHAIGKQMFLRFDNDLTLRIHLGIYGKWNYHQLNESRTEVPEPVGQVRARFSNDQAAADLRGPTVCEVISAEEVAAVENRLGPDPLNANPKNREAERFISRVLASRTSIGLQLMNQDVIAGIGNVYRAELLFRAGIDPHTPGNLIPREQLQAIWDDSVTLLKVGVAKGIMITRDELFKKRPKKEDRYFAYKREGLPCRECGTNIAIELMAARKLYWCPGCQK